MADKDEALGEQNKWLRRQASKVQEELTDRDAQLGRQQETVQMQNRTAEDLAGLAIHALSQRLGCPPMIQSMVKALAQSRGGLL